MNELFVGVSCLLFTTLTPSFESHFHTEDNICDMTSSGYNSRWSEQLATGWVVWGSNPSRGGGGGGFFCR